MVEYNYDAWGRIIARTGSLASTLGYLNPFRYRGYVYDEETRMYYLKSRYYNPEWGRFINADVVLGKQGALLGHNLFAYCRNCPLMYSDYSGYMPMYTGSLCAPTEMDVKNVYSLAGSLFLQCKGYDIAKVCYIHFLNGEGESLPNETLSAIGKAVSESNEFKRFIIDNAPNDSWIWLHNSDESAVIEMSGDLHYAIQHIKPKSICFRTNDAICGISFFSDLYDFQYRTQMEEPNFFKRTVNNEIGYALQENGLGTNYWIDVKFLFYIPLNE